MANYEQHEHDLHAHDHPEHDVILQEQPPVPNLHLDHHEGHHGEHGDEPCCGVHHEEASSHGQQMLAEVVHTTHAEKDHVHGPNCGHTSEHANDHADALFAKAHHSHEEDHSHDHCKEACCNVSNEEANLVAASLEHDHDHNHEHEHHHGHVCNAVCEHTTKLAEDSAQLFYDELAAQESLSSSEIIERQMAEASLEATEATETINTVETGATTEPEHVVQENQQKEADASVAIVAPKKSARPDNQTVATALERRDDVADTPVESVAIESIPQQTIVEAENIEPTVAAVEFQSDETVSIPLQLDQEQATEISLYDNFESSTVAAAEDSFEHIENSVTEPGAISPLAEAIEIPNTPESLVSPLTNEIHAAIVNVPQETIVRSVLPKVEQVLTSLDAMVEKAAELPPEALQMLRDVMEQAFAELEISPEAIQEMLQLVGTNPESLHELRGLLYELKKRIGIEYNLELTGVLDFSSNDNKPSDPRLLGQLLLSLLFGRQRTLNY